METFPAEIIQMIIRQTIEDRECPIMKIDDVRWSEYTGSACNIRSVCRLWRDVYDTTFVPNVYEMTRCIKSKLPTSMRYVLKRSKDIPSEAIDCALVPTFISKRDEITDRDQKKVFSIISKYGQRKIDPFGFVSFQKILLEGDTSSRTLAYYASDEMYQMLNDPNAIKHDLYDSIVNIPLVSFSLTDSDVWKAFMKTSSFDDDFFNKMNTLYLGRDGTLDEFAFFKLWRKQSTDVSRLLHYVTRFCDKRQVFSGFSYQCLLMKKGNKEDIVRFLSLKKIPFHEREFGFINKETYSYDVAMELLSRGMITISREMVDCITKMIVDGNDDQFKTYITRDLLLEMDHDLMIMNVFDTRKVDRIKFVLSVYEDREITYPLVLLAKETVEKGYLDFLFRLPGIYEHVVFDYLLKRIFHSFSLDQIKKIFRETDFDLSSQRNLALRVVCRMNLRDADLLNFILDDPRVDPTGQYTTLIHSTISARSHANLSRLLRDSRIMSVLTKQELTTFLQESMMLLEDQNDRHKRRRME